MDEVSLWLVDPGGSSSAQPYGENCLLYSIMGFTIKEKQYK